MTSGRNIARAFYTFDDGQKRLALETREKYQADLAGKGYGRITTEVLDASTFYYAEDYSSAVPGKKPWWLLRSGRNRGKL